MNQFPKLPIKKYVIVGSYAMGTRYAKDIDVIAYKKDIETDFTDNEYLTGFEWNDRRVEVLLADNQESLQMILDRYSYSESCMADYSILYALKRGHIYFPHKQWRKHIHDLHTLEALCGGVPEFPFIMKLIKTHHKSTEERIGKLKTPKLNGVTKESFFDDFVQKFFEHDDIHRVMAHKEKPMYSYMQKDPASVECSKELWNTFSEEEKIMTVLEEAYVIALERHIIPTIKGLRVGYGNHEAFEWALMRICTNLCSGFFRAFAVDNYFKIFNSYNKKYVEKFMKHVEQGSIQSKISSELVA